MKTVCMSGDHPLQGREPDLNNWEPLMSTEIQSVACCAARAFRIRRVPRVVLRENGVLCLARPSRWITPLLVSGALVDWVAKSYDGKPKVYTGIDHMPR
jgi:hypothetical protein